MARFGQVGLRFTGDLIDPSSRRYCSPYAFNFIAAGPAGALPRFKPVIKRRVAVYCAGRDLDSEVDACNGSVSISRCHPIVVCAKHD